MAHDAPSYAPIMTPQDPPVNRKEKLFSVRQIEDLIARGHKIVIVENKVIKTDAWLPYHPGGPRAIMHMVGRDATDEVNALHSPEARERMEKFVIGRVEGRWKSFRPPIQGGTFRRLSSAARQAEGQDTTDQQDVDSSDSSLTSSPMFEAIGRPSVRQRKVTRAASSSSTSTSLSSLDVSQPKEDSPMDLRTKKEIEDDLAKYPSLDETTQDNIISKYRLLNQRIRAEGLYNCNYTAYGWELARYSLLFGLCLLLLHWGWYGTSGLFLGMFWHQLVFTAHDAGHMGITHNFKIDTVIGIVVADFIGGLSLGWWKHSHNVHHIVTNSPEHDPDIELMPFFAISHRFFDSLRSTYYERIMPYDPFAKWAVQYQHLLYYPILAFGRFNLYFLSWEHILRGLGPRKGMAAWHRWLELTGQIFFWIWFGYGILYRTIPTWWGRVVFVLVSHTVTGPLHVQITLSHFAMSTADLGPDESFPQKMLRTTMDVDCPQWLDWFHGGLQFQAIHHLYPRVPRHNLRKAQKMVQDFCDEVGIPYALYGFTEGNKRTIGRLGEVGKQAKILAECQKKAAETVLHAH